MAFLGSLYTVSLGGPGRMMPRRSGKSSLLAEAAPGRNHRGIPSFCLAAGFSSSKQPFLERGPGTSPQCGTAGSSSAALGRVGGRLGRWGRSKCRRASADDCQSPLGCSPCTTQRHGLLIDVKADGATKLLFQAFCYCCYLFHSSRNLPY